MSKRKTALEALEWLTKVDDTDSNAGSKNEADFADDDFFDSVHDDIFVFDASALWFNHTYPTDSTQSSQLSDCDPNLDKTSKSGVIWTKLKDAEENKIRNKILARQVLLPQG